MNKTEEGVSVEEFIYLINNNKLKMYKTAMAILKNQEDVNDAIQETLLSAYKSINNLKHKEYFTTWIITILRNKCFDIIKKNQKIINIEDSAIDINDNYYDTYKVESNVERAINRLDEDLREITVLYYYDELGIKDIASIMGVPEGTIKSRLSRIRSILKVFIEEEEGDKR